MAAVYAIIGYIILLWTLYRVGVFFDYPEHSIVVLTMAISFCVGWIFGRAE